MFRHGQLRCLGCDSIFNSYRLLEGVVKALNFFRVSILVKWLYFNYADTETNVRWPIRTTENFFCLWHCFEKNNKNVSKTKKFYFHCENTFVSEMDSK